MQHRQSAKRKKKKIDQSWTGCTAAKRKCRRAPSRRGVGVNATPTGRVQGSRAATGAEGRACHRQPTVRPEWNDTCHCDAATPSPPPQSTRTLQPGGAHPPPCARMRHRRRGRAAAGSATEPRDCPVRHPSTPNRRQRCRWGGGRPGERARWWKGRGGGGGDGEPKWRARRGRGRGRGGGESRDTAVRAARWFAGSFASHPAAAPPPPPPPVRRSARGTPARGPVDGDTRGAAPPSRPPPTPAPRSLR